MSIRFWNDAREKETCLAFGQQEEKDGIRYYLIYGVEKKRTSGAEIFRIFRSWSGLEKLKKGSCRPVLDHAGRRNPDRRLFYFL